MIKYRIQLFGNFVIYQGRKKIALPRSRKARSLLAYLLTYHNRSFSRTKLSGLFWTDVPEKKATASLRKAIYEINHYIPDFITKNGHELQMNADKIEAVDIDTFYQQTRNIYKSDQISIEDRNIFLNAREIYHEDFLSDIYDDWVFDIQEQLRMRYEKILNYLLKFYKMDGQYLDALSVANEIYQINPYQEENVQELIHLLLNLQKPQRAFQYFEKFRKDLKREFNEEPTAKTYGLLRQIRNRQSQVENQQPEQASFFIGRELEKEWVFKKIKTKFNVKSQSNDNKAVCLVVEGETGIGKTAFLNEIAKESKWNGYEVFFSSARETNFSQSFSVIVNAINNNLTEIKIKQIVNQLDSVWIQVLSFYLPQLKKYVLDIETPPPIQVNQEMERIVEAFVQFFYCWSQISPIVILLDDLHHIDNDSLNFYPLFFKRIKNEKIVVVGAIRKIEIQKNKGILQKLEENYQIIDIKRLSLLPLEISEIQKIINEQLDSNKPSQELLDYLTEKSRGNPLFLKLIIQDLKKENMLNVDSSPNSQFFNLIKLPTPQKIESIILYRFLSLSEEKREMIEIFTVINQDITFEMVDELIKENQNMSHQLLINLIELGFLKENYQGYEFVQNFYRELIYQSLDIRKKKYLHKKILKILEKTGSYTNELLTQHALQAEEWEKVIRYGIEAIQEARNKLAFEKGIEYCITILNVLNEKLSFAQKKKNQLVYTIYQNLYQLYRATNKVAEQKVHIKKMAHFARKYLSPVEYLNCLNNEADYFLRHIMDHQQARKISHRILKKCDQYKNNQQDYVEQIVKALLIIGISYCYQYNFNKAKKYLVKAFRYFNKSTLDLSIRLEIVYYVGLSFYFLSEFGRFRSVVNIFLNELKQNKLPEISGNMYILLNMYNYYKENRVNYLKYAQDAYKQFKKTGIRPLEARGLLNLGLAYKNLSDYGTAFMHAKEATRIYEEVDFQSGLINSYYQTAVLARYIGDWETAEINLNKGHELAKQQENTNWNIRYKIEYIQSCLDKNDLIAVDSCFDFVKTNIPKINYIVAIIEYHFAYGRYLLKINKYDKALSHFKKMESFAKKTRDKDSIGISQAFQAYVLYVQHKYKKIPAYIKILSDTVNNLHLGEQLQIIYYYYALLLMHVKDYQKSFENVEKAYQIINQVADSIDQPEIRSTFLSQIPLNEDIFNLHLTLKEKVRGKMVYLKLPKLSAPHRGKLDANQYVEVKWTISSPRDHQIKSKKKLRHVRILRLLDEAQAQSAVPTLPDLVKALDVSLKTIKRDVAELRESGYEIVTRGSLLE
ncbi:MAG: DUF1670 domain-containing protein [Spirochaetes bacterium]|nr:DUF1670 domain-containing protein [Spirochaetota bacterium]